jgi:hypothetical protein
MAAPQSTPLPEAPQRGEPESVFIPKSNAFVASLEPLRQELQAQADYIDGGVQAVTDATAQAVTDATQGAEDARDAAQLAEAGAQTAQGRAEDARDAAQLAETGAQTAQGLAENARDAAQLAETGAVAAKDEAAGIVGVAGVFADTASGVAGTTDGEYFALSTDGSVWLNNAGVAEQVTDYATLANAIGMISAALDAINGEVV